VSTISGTRWHVTSESWQVSLGILVDVAEEPEVTLFADNNQFTLLSCGCAGELVLCFPGILFPEEGEINVGDPKCHQGSKLDREESYVISLTCLLPERRGSMRKMALCDIPTRVWVGSFCAYLVSGQISETTMLSSTFYQNRRKQSGNGSKGGIEKEKKKEGTNPLFHDLAVV